MVQIAELQGAVGRAGRLMSALGEREEVGSGKKAERGGGLQLLPLRTAGPVGKACGSSALELRQEDYGVSLGYIVRPCLGGKKNKKQKHQKSKLLLPQTTAKIKANGVAIS